MNHRILVIDDDPKILETCQMILAPETSKAGGRTRIYGR